MVKYDQQTSSNPWQVLERYVSEAAAPYIAQHTAEEERQSGRSKPVSSEKATQHQSEQARAMEEGTSSMGRPIRRSTHASPHVASSNADSTPQTSERSPSHPQSVPVVEADGPPASMETEELTTIQSSISERQTLIRALQDSARLRRGLAKTDEVIARYHELLIENDNRMPSLAHEQ
ncbi:MAG: hypothetical protein M1816_003792 [Peltula sp. TS41687]|nr:MAG: hypothetical protein M1816_003792 [Peltula sp. TS41687]